MVHFETSLPTQLSIDWLVGKVVYHIDMVLLSNR